MPSHRLIILRHATAEEGGGVPDADRRLTQAGIAEAERVGHRLMELGFQPERAICSPAMRCRETWEAVASGLHRVPPVDYEEALYNAPVHRLRQVIAGAAQVRILLLLAHQPGVGRLAFELGGGNETQAAILRAGFSPATMAVFEIDGDGADPEQRRARLIHFERPSAS